MNYIKSFCWRCSLGNFENNINTVQKVLLEEEIDDYSILIKAQCSQCKMHNTIITDKKKADAMRISIGGIRDG